jgi:hypothetical protein
MPKDDDQFDRRIRPVARIVLQTLFAATTCCRRLAIVAPSILLAGGQTVRREFPWSAQQHVRMKHSNNIHSPHGFGPWLADLECMPRMPVAGTVRTGLLHL